MIHLWTGLTQLVMASAVRNNFRHVYVYFCFLSLLWSILLRCAFHSQDSVCHLDSSPVR